MKNKKLIVLLSLCILALIVVGVFILSSSNAYATDTIYKVVFKDGDFIVSEQNVAVGQSVSVPSEFKKDGYVFVGWSFDGLNAVNLEDIEITSDTIFIALWSEKSTFYTVCKNFITNFLGVEGSSTVVGQIIVDYFPYVMLVLLLVLLMKLVVWLVTCWR